MSNESILLVIGRYPGELDKREAIEFLILEEIRETIGPVDIVRCVNPDMFELLTNRYEDRIIFVLDYDNHKNNPRRFVSIDVEGYCQSRNVFYCSLDRID